MKNMLLFYTSLNFLLIFICAKISYKLKFLDNPNKRKIHKVPIAYTGGVALSIGYLFALEMFDVTDKDLNLILSIGFLITFVGLIDDKYQLNIGGKLSLQIIPIFYLIVVENIKITSLGNYNYFILELGYFSVPFTLLCVLFLLNAFNYFDGVDGSLSFCVISSISILYFLTNKNEVNLFILLILIPLCLFLLFNFKLFNLPKLFLGDNGSLLFGFIISFLLIYFANKQIVHPILCAWSISIFVFEFIAINLIRIKKKSKLFKAAQDHLHHILLKKNNSIFLTNTIMVFLNIFLFSIGYLSYKLIGPDVSLVLFIISFMVYLFFRYKFNQT